MMSVRGGHDWEIEGNVIEWGNAQGLDIGGEGWSDDLAQQPRVSDLRSGHVVRRNRVWNNLLIDNQRGGVSLNPEVPKAEGNRSEGNIFVQSDAALACRLEDGGSGVRWEQTEVGKALGRAGVGDMILTLDAWRQHAGHDRSSLLVPRDGLTLPEDPEPLLALLTRLWPPDAPPLDGGWADVGLVPASPSAIGGQSAVDWRLPRTTRFRSASRWEVCDEAC